MKTKYQKNHCQYLLVSSCLVTNVHELPDENVRNGTNLTLSARIDALEAETQQLKALTQAKKLSHGILVVSVMTMNLSDSTQALYRMKFSWPSEFLGPSVDQGEKYSIM